MLKKDLYTQGHLVVSAIRVLEHRTGKPPTVEDICQMLLLSLEQGHLLCKRLHEAGVIDREEGAREAVEAAGYVFDPLVTRTMMGL